MAIRSEADLEYFYDDKDSCIKSRWKNWGSLRPQGGQACVYMVDRSHEAIISALTDAYNQGRSHALQDLSKLLVHPT